MEVIIAVAIITTALAVLIALVSFSVAGVGPGKSKLIAVNLSQEGIEIIRNIRDSNWLSYKRSSGNWRDGLDAGDYRVQYDKLVLLSFSDTPLKIDSSGFYQYNNGNNTSFYRKISLGHIGNNQIKVTSEVTWQEKGRAQSVQAEERLYNWLEE